jgi:hypothetical protein
MNDDRWAFPPQPPAWPPAPSTAPSRRASRLLPLIALFVTTGIVAAAIGVGSVLLVRHIQGTQSTPGAPTAAPGTTSGAAEARALYQQAVAATRGSTGFHYVGVSSGGQPETIVGDAGQSAGRQQITFVASYGTEQFTLLLVGTTVYFHGNAPAAEDQLGVSTATAPSVAGKWVSVATGDGPYNQLQVGITVADQAKAISLTPESSARITSAGGGAATRISGIALSPPPNNLPVGPGSLDIAPRTDLPITFRFTDPSGGSFTGTFSAWGTAPSVSAPTGVVAWSGLTTATPPGGYGSGGGATSTPAPTGTPGAA